MTKYFFIVIDCFELEKLWIETGICRREKVLEKWELAKKKNPGVCFLKSRDFGLTLVRSK